MIEFEFNFRGNLEISELVFCILKVDIDFRPVYFTIEENVKNRNDRVNDYARFSKFINKHKSGFYLVGENFYYNILRINSENFWKFEGCFDGYSKNMEFFLKYFSKLNPVFGFACLKEEREAKNRHKIQIGINKVESWVGRNIEKVIPGLYWMTIISDEILMKYNVPLSAIRLVSKEYSDLGNGVHFLKFYENPEDWNKTLDVKNLCASFPGIFDIDDVYSIASNAKGVMELLALLRGL